MKHIEYDFTLYPRINHTNQKIVEDYKKLLLVYNPQLKSFFFGGFLARLLSSMGNLNLEYYAGFLIGNESVKKILELYKNRIELPNEKNFYLIKLVKTKIQKEIERESLKKKRTKLCA